MKRIALLFIGLTAGLSVLWAGVVNAANVRSGDAPRVSAGEVIDGTLYVAGKDVRIEGTVKGDLMCAGQNVEVTGTVQGDVICAGQLVNDASANRPALPSLMGMRN